MCNHNCAVMLQLWNLNPCGTFILYSDKFFVTLWKKIGVISPVIKKNKIKWVHDSTIKDFFFMCRINLLQCICNLKSEILQLQKRANVAWALQNFWISAIVLLPRYQHVLASFCREQNRRSLLSPRCIGLEGSRLHWIQASSTWPDGNLSAPVFIPSNYTLCLTHAVIFIHGIVHLSRFRIQTLCLAVGAETQRHVGQ